MSASSRILDNFVKSNGSEPIRILGASGQLGYGVPTPAFNAGLERAPHLIGCDMGSIDPGPYYLGSGELATAPAATRRDLRKVLLGALKLKIPLVIGSAGSAGAKPHLEQTLAIVREIAREEGLHFRLGVLRADIDKVALKAAVASGGVVSIDDMPALDTQEVDVSSNIVGQMGMSAFQRALAAGVDAIIAGRACDTAIFAALPAMAGFPVGPAQHMAKIIECASLCCVPGGRDSILATLDYDGFVLESMAPQRRATPVSVAAHSLYEQADPFTVQEPEGRLDLARATYEAIDERRTRVAGAIWQDAKETWVKIEGARPAGERAILLCGTADPRFIAQHVQLLKEIEGVVRDLVCEDAQEDYVLTWRVYGVNGVRMTPVMQNELPAEAFIMGECIAPTRARAAEVVRTTKQYLLHHGYEGRLSTGGKSRFSVHAAGGLGGARLSLQHLSPHACSRSRRPVPVRDRNALGAVVNAHHAPSDSHLDTYRPRALRSVIKDRGAEPNAVLFQAARANPPRWPGWPGLRSARTIAAMNRRRFLVGLAGGGAALVAPASAQDRPPMARLRAIGRLELLPARTLAAVRAAEAATKHYEGMQLAIAAAYSGRQEITDAVQSLLREQLQNGRTPTEAIEAVTPEAIDRHIYSPDLPDPDLIIRTSGEVRLSGFLLWQSTSSEFYFSEVNWPAFRKIDFLRAIRSFQGRKRRYGL